MVAMAMEDLEVITVSTHTWDIETETIREEEILVLAILKIEILNQLVCRLVIVVIIENLQFISVRYQK
jgi:hypothetical protein